MIGIERLIARGLSTAVDLMRPPAFSPPPVERAFLDAQGRRYAAQRRVGVFLALALWLAYIASDVFDVYRGPDPAASQREALIIRGVGAAVLAVGAPLSLGRWFRDNQHAQALILPIFAMLFVMVMRIIAIQGPQGSESSDSGLMVALLFLVAFFRLKSTTVTALLFSCFAARIVTFPIFSVPGAKYHIDLGAFDLGRYLGILGRPDFFTSFFDLFCFVLAGCVIAAELERGDRAALGRERELAGANQDLLASRRDAEAKATALVEAKEELLALATQASLDKSKFLADAAHDLAQPIHAVSLLIEAVRQALVRRDTRGAQALIGDAGRAAQVARSSFKAVLEVSRLETGLVEPVYSVFDVNDLVREVVVSLGAVARDRGVDLRARPSRHRPMTRSDRALLGRIIANLADNAVKYADPARPVRRVLVGVTALPGKVRIVVSDNGVGIPDAKRDEIFKPFIQLGNPGHDRDQGLGLGLSIVAAGVRALAGHRIALRSAQGAGTRFSIETPRAPASPATASPLAAIGEPAVEGMSTLFIWLIETDQTARAATRALLDACGVLTEEASDLDELEHALAVCERRPDLVICGEEPVDGRDATQVGALLSARWGAAPPVLILGESPAPGDIGSPPDVLRLRKPVDPEHLIGAIRRLCLPLETMA